MQNYDHGKGKGNGVDLASSGRPNAGLSDWRVQLQRDVFGLNPSDQASALLPPAPTLMVQPAGMTGQASSDSIKRSAALGIQGSGSSLPHLDRIQSAFGGHDLSSVQAHVGGPATEASRSMGATAYATGKHVAFRSQPDLHTAAHEAAHVVQQRAGVSIPGGVGKVGDSFEKQADAVANRVVKGLPAGDLLPGASAETSSSSIQNLSDAVQTAPSASGKPETYKPFQYARSALFKPLRHVSVEKGQELENKQIELFWLYTYKPNNLIRHVDECSSRNDYLNLKRDVRNAAATLKGYFTDLFNTDLEGKNSYYHAVLLKKGFAITTNEIERSLDVISHKGSPNDVLVVMRSLLNDQFKTSALQKLALATLERYPTKEVMDSITTFAEKRGLEKSVREKAGDVIKRMGPRIAANEKAESAITSLKKCLDDYAKQIGPDQNKVLEKIFQDVGAGCDRVCGMYNRLAKDIFKDLQSEFETKAFDIITNVVKNVFVTAIGVASTPVGVVLSIAVLVGDTDKAVSAPRISDHPAGSMLEAIRTIQSKMIKDLSSSLGKWTLLGQVLGKINAYAKTTIPNELADLESNLKNPSDSLKSMELNYNQAVKLAADFELFLRTYRESKQKAVATSSKMVTAADTAYNKLSKEFDKFKKDPRRIIRAYVSG